ncbi:lipoprotein signal peptidase [Caulobacter vibrioides]|uniref:Lipoprotein signal peptidase n=2 Tax=Caulobacter vibrioides TaxID=155892 RepID=LSPA_CAUVC|nr:signal peptidase II [Caulobacter vibrioides]YP_002516109.2 lipoprotein signal peptidase [Caulobacter vibrioides NA1000]Q9AAA6.1 RecName: Full=Lipoprotein signal peptidase; AltName: Full=Prolipoprotein signal peptidase; AltName: Full=Signal peptidase II; Short=SPase II [Caulobacter vibrioides CB15]AAK22685.1 lipoprotein signal peptidase [Caulobacter vibrioides CB15]ACL94201.2 lipoprotein signal peptidase [Caulobacter vibrioides NA1000]ATC23665.1 lipoprotein signal peptidase [Caulobacter vibr
MPSLSITRQGWIAYAIAAVTVVLDQISKLWILGLLGREPGASLPLLGPIHLTMVHNYGMSFGLLRDSDWGRWLLIGFSILVVIGLAVWVHKATRPLLAVGIGLIIGGAIGNNLIDRVIYGYVVDFIDVSRLYFPWVFNIADSGISVGVALLLLDSFLSEENKLSHQTE